MKTLETSAPWAPLPEEKNIAIPGYRDFEFTRHWFRSRNQVTWSTFLQPRFGNIVRPLKMLQIGVFEGADLTWCFSHILQHPHSRAIAIDPWLETTKLSAEYMEQVRQRAVRNLERWRSKLEIKHGLSQDILPLIDDEFDLVVIDGDHTAEAVLIDATHAIRLTKPGGWIVFDDVRNRIPKEHHVAEGIDHWLRRYGDHVALAWKHRFVDCYEVRKAIPRK